MIRVGHLSKRSLVQTLSGHGQSLWGQPPLDVRHALAIRISSEDQSFHLLLQIIFHEQPSVRFQKAQDAGIIVRDWIFIKRYLTLQDGNVNQRKIWRDHAERSGNWREPDRVRSPCVAS
jgi:hypothetical protein